MLITLLLSSLTIFYQDSVIVKIKNRYTTSDGQTVVKMRYKKHNIKTTCFCDVPLYVKRRARVKIPKTFIPDVIK